MLKIAFISQPEYFRFMYENELDCLGDVKEFVFNFSMKEEDFEALEKFAADINIFFRGEYFPKNVLGRLKGVKINLSSEPFPNIVDGELNYTSDSLSRYMIFRVIRHKAFDYVFHYDVSSLPFIRNDGINLSGEFYFPVATGVYKRKIFKKKWDFFFIGRSTAHREKFFVPLKHHYNFLHICHGIWGEELVDYMNQSKILLNVHAENEISWEPRVQMLMASGNMVMSEKISKNAYLSPGSDYIEIHNPYELYEKAKYYLKQDDEREKIAQNGFEKVHDLFDSKKNFTRFIEDILSRKYNKVSFSESRLNLSLLKIKAGVKDVLASCRGWRYRL